MREQPSSYIFEQIIYARLRSDLPLLATNLFVGEISRHTGSHLQMTDQVLPLKFASLNSCKCLLYLLHRSVLVTTTSCARGGVLTHRTAIAFIARL